MQHVSKSVIGQFLVKCDWLVWRETDLQFSSWLGFYQSTVQVNGDNGRFKMPFRDTLRLCESSLCETVSLWYALEVVLLCLLGKLYPGCALVMVPKFNGFCFGLESLQQLKVCPFSLLYVIARVTDSTLSSFYAFSRGICNHSHTHTPPHPHTHPHQASETEIMTRWMTCMTQGYHCTTKMCSNMASGSRLRYICFLHFPHY